MEDLLEEKAIELRFHKQEAFTNRTEEKGSLRAGNCNDEGSEFGKQQDIKWGMRLVWKDRRDLNVQSKQLDLFYRILTVFEVGSSKLRPCQYCEKCTWWIWRQRLVSGSKLFPAH